MILVDKGMLIDGVNQEYAKKLNCLGGIVKGKNKSNYYFFIYLFIYFSNSYYEKSRKLTLFDPV